MLLWRHIRYATTNSPSHVLTALRPGSLRDIIKWRLIRQHSLVPRLINSAVEASRKPQLTLARCGVIVPASCSQPNGEVRAWHPMKRQQLCQGASTLPMSAMGDVAGDG
jgi:hypothetical protein